MQKRKIYSSVPSHTHTHTLFRSHTQSLSHTYFCFVTSSFGPVSSTLLLLLLLLICCVAADRHILPHLA